MKFGPIPVAEATGAILAHSVALEGLRLRKGRVITAADVAALEAAGLSRVVVARLEPGDVDEDRAAARLAAAAVPEPGRHGLSVSAPFTGRVNIHAEMDGVLDLESATIRAANGIAESLTLATLPRFSRVGARQMVATAKVIPYAAEVRHLAAAEEVLRAAAPVLRVRPVTLRSASLILTRTTGMADKLVEKGIGAVTARLTALGVTLAGTEVVAHEAETLAAALPRADGEMVLILTGSATSDREDVGPLSVTLAGGALTRLGMPVDPGNLLFLGRLGSRPVIGLPGCARSPKLNGADWVLERVACGIEVSGEDIAAMGVGGLLKEIASRPAPRAVAGVPTHRPVVSALVLAAGASSRMQGRDKLLEPVDGEPLLRRTVRVAAASGAEEVVAVIRPGDDARRRALAGATVALVENPRAAEGMGTSIAAGLAALRPDADGVLVMLADMPDLAPADLDRLIAALDEDEGRAIVRAVDESGTPGHPVLFGRRFFELLRGLEGERGAREVLRDYPEFITEVALPGSGATTDLDTPQEWAAWRERKAGTGGR